VPRSHTGVAPEHWALEVHATQTPRPRSQAGVAPPHRAALVAEHWPQAPLGWHAGVAPPQSVSAPQARQLCDVASHTGVVPPHCASLRQATQLPEAGRQSGVAPVHRLALVAEHSPQAPLGWQAGAAPPHSPSPAQPRQVWNVESHLGAAAGQSPSARQETQLPLGAWQSGFVPMQRLVFVAEHWPQAPLAWHAGVAPPHSPSPAQARQMCAATLQTGVTPPHSALEMQLTQVPLATLQAGIEPVHRLVLVAEQTPQAPLGWQAGVPPPQSPSPPQPRQLWLVGSQIGVVPEQSPLARQETHVPVVVRQSGVPPVQRSELPAEHWPQAPPGWHAGVAPPHSLSPLQARQLCDAGSQTGVAPEQSELTRQGTQVPVGV
jgi:hypothetical protein